MKEESNNKPIIETMINTCALALTTFGVQHIISHPESWKAITVGMIIISFGGGLEFVKYYGRKQKFW